MKIDPWILAEYQKLPLSVKIKMTLNRIEEWHRKHDSKIYVSFSGGKDSTVLLDLTRKINKSIVAVFSDTGLEYPEVRKFVKGIENVIWIKPKKTFRVVIKDYGFPVVSKEVSQKIYEIKNTNSDKLRNKRLFGDEKGYGKLPNKWRFLLESDFKISDKCCDWLKKAPFKKYEKESGNFPIVGTMASDSHSRKTSYLRNGCLSFGGERPMATPIAFWLEKDIWDYIRKEKLDYSPIYDLGYDNTGCMFCMFGAHLDPPTRNKFIIMKRTHPAQWRYCVEKLGCGDVLDFVGVKSGRKFGPLQALLACKNDN